MPELKTVRTPKPHNFFYYWIGLIALVLIKARNYLRGYKTPRTFPMAEIKKAIEYDFSVVNHWLRVLEEYANAKPSLTGKAVLELGPGADLGIGLLLLAKGARKYNAIDVNNLVEHVPENFYDGFFDHLRANKENGQTDIGDLRAQLKLTQAGKNDRLNYICRKDFDISVFGKEKIDLVFSQAAFEHFDNIDMAFSQLSKVVRSGAILVAEIDLNTHTRWLRDVDPLNIYRYRDPIYDFFRFRGSPNRLRPFEYKQTLEKYEWEDVRILPLTAVGNDYLSKVRNTLAPRFRGELSQIEYLSVMVCARRK
jgi:SAM-dependent methyltransferase